jgi:mannose-6-phosphate isomerase-like protein (cupin superfamily)
MTRRVVFAVMVAAFSVSALTAQDTTARDAKNMEQKLQALLENGQLPTGKSKPLRTTFTEPEVNAYMAVSKDVELPVGVRDPRLTIDGGNHLSGRDPIKSDQLGCTASARTTLLQIRDDLEEKSMPDADEVLYVVAGQGSLRLGNKDVPLEAGGLAVVPRGTVRGLSRKGKNPLIVLSVVSGPPCTK